MIRWPEQFDLTLHFLISLLIGFEFNTWRRETIECKAVCPWQWHNNSKNIWLFDFLGQEWFGIGEIFYDVSNKTNEFLNKRRQGLFEKISHFLFSSFNQICSFSLYLCCHFHPLAFSLGERRRSMTIFFFIWK